MMKLRAIIIDDVEKARAALRADLEDYCPEVELVAEAEGVQTGLEAIRKHQPDVVFLDIQMEDGTGFDLLNALGTTTAKVIFTTALNDYAIRAFKFSAVDYLLKPVDPDELVDAIQKIIRQQKANAPGLPEAYSLLLENLKEFKHQKAEKIALNTADKIHIISISDILRCQSENNYTIFFLSNKRQILVTKTLKEFEEILKENGFFRPHQSHLVNLDRVQEFIKSDGGWIKMQDGSEVPVSSRKKEMLLKKLAEI